MQVFLVECGEHCIPSRLQTDRVVRCLIGCSEVWNLRWWNTWPDFVQLLLKETNTSLFRVLSSPKAKELSLTFSFVISESQLFPTLRLILIASQEWMFVCIVCLWTFNTILLDCVWCENPGFGTDLGESDNVEQPVLKKKRWTNENFNDISKMALPSLCNILDRKSAQSPLRKTLRVTRAEYRMPTL